MEIGQISIIFGRNLVKQKRVNQKLKRNTKISVEGKETVNRLGIGCQF